MREVYVITNHKLTSVYFLKRCGNSVTPNSVNTAINPPVQGANPI